MGISNVVVLIDENIPNMVQDMYWSNEAACCSVFLMALLTKFMQADNNIRASFSPFN